MIIEIITSRIWKHPQIMSVILRNVPTLDLMVIILNSVVYYTTDDVGDIMSFATIKKFGSLYELGTVYTAPQYRGRGHSSQIINYITNHVTPVVLLCHPKLKSFYESVGFRKCDKCDTITNTRRKAFNLLLAPFAGYKIISMINSTSQSY